MPRLQQTLVAKREQFVLDLFKQNPKLSVAKANEQLKNKFNDTMMRNARMYELRKMAEEELQKAKVTVSGQRLSIPLKVMLRARS